MYAHHFDEGQWSHRILMLAGIAALVVGLAWVWLCHPTVSASQPNPLSGDLRDTPSTVSPAPIHGVAYGPFRSGQSPEDHVFPTLAEVRTDMPLLKSIANGVRTYGCVNLETVITATAEAGLPLAQGIWLNSDAAANQREMDCAIGQAASHPHIQSLVVGNEAILVGSLTVPQLCQYLAQAKSQSGLPVTTAEPWNVWVANPALIQCVDYLSVNIYAYWDGQAVEDAVDYTAARYAQARALAGDKPVVISEVGWPTAGTAKDKAVPGVAEQARFAAAFLNWAKGEAINWYWFAAFDEVWKCDRGRPDVECHWGLYQADRTPKPAQRAFVPSVVWLPAIFKQPSSTPTPSPTATPTQTPSPTSTASPTPTRTATPPTSGCTITWPTNNSTVSTTGNCIVIVSGTAWGVPSGGYVDFWVYTNNWYRQDPTVHPPVPAGNWQASPIYLAGQDAYNYHTIRADLHSSTGAVVASCRVSGVVRSNGCSTP